MVRQICDFRANRVVASAMAVQGVYCELVSVFPVNTEENSENLFRAAV